MRRALVENATGRVINVIEIAAGSGWPIPEGHILRVVGPNDPVAAGDTWDGFKFVPKPVAPPTPQEAAQARYIAAVKANRTRQPFGSVMYDQAVASGEIEG
ncbi:hypothetical protein LCGC14_2360180 [marine sediment metagenome]|uniref:Uncharacterized protein n=1 Tax=marine sediment metagenome TaxID=412755 RepID=A0A0F9CU38_9ZZZZ